jgi:hypothetical protein
MLASAGIVYLIRLGMRYVGATWQVAPTAFAALSLLLSFTLGLFILQNQSILASEETGALRGAERFTHLLEGQLQPGDGVLALLPADAPLEYYFLLNELPASYLNTDLASKRRLFVVVYRPATTLAATLERAGLSSGDFGVPELVAHVEPAYLYQIERLGAPAEK